MNRLAGKRALITGGTSGIGLETARRFVTEGAQVLVTGVTPASIEKARQILGDEVPVGAGRRTRSRCAARPGGAGA